MIDSPKNPWIRSLIQLQTAKHRRAQGKFLIEGTNLIDEAIACDWPIDAVLATSTWTTKNKGFMSAFDVSKLHTISEKVLERLCTTESPDGVIAVALSSKAVEVKTKSGFSLALDNIQDPGNLGTLIRTAVASECDAIYVSPGSVDAMNPKVLRSSAGLWFRKTPVAIELENLIASKRSQHVQVLAAASGGRSLWETDLSVPSIVLLGNEGQGLSKSVIDLSDDVITVPMAAIVESLNVAMVGSIIAYEAARQRQSS